MSARFKDNREDVHTHWCQGCGRTWDCSNTKRPCIIRVKCTLAECQAVHGENHFHEETVPEVIHPSKCEKCR